MTLDELVDHIDELSIGKRLFVTRRQRRRVVALTIESLPRNYDEALALRPNLRTSIEKKVRVLYRERYGFNPLIILAIQVIVQLIISWWMSNIRHIEIANNLRSQGRTL